MTQVRRSLLSLVVLLLVALALAGVALRSHQQDEAKKAAEEKSAQLFDFDPAQVTGLTVEARGEQTVLVRQGAGFGLLKPFATAADTEAVNGVLQRLRARCAARARWRQLRPTWPSTGSTIPSRG